MVGSSVSHPTPGDGPDWFCLFTIIALALFAVPSTTTVGACCFLHATSLLRVAMGFCKAGGEMPLMSAEQWLHFVARAESSDAETDMAPKYVFQRSTDPGGRVILHFFWYILTHK